ncbi:MAG: hypothetical protein Q7T01_02065 [bacterium]|nr:hypothetical protein [bacterium]
MQPTREEVLVKLTSTMLVAVALVVAAFSMNQRRDPIPSCDEGCTCSAPDETSPADRIQICGTFSPAPAVTTAPLRLSLPPERTEWLLVEPLTTPTLDCRIGGEYCAIAMVYGGGLCFVNLFYGGFAPVLALPDADPRDSYLSYQLTPTAWNRWADASHAHHPPWPCATGTMLAVPAEIAPLIFAPLTTGRDLPDTAYPRYVQGTNPAPHRASTWH